MIIVDLCNHQAAKAGGAMAKRRNVKDSFGKRVRDEREERELTQSDMIRLLSERYGIQMSEAAFSKIEIGETKRLHIDLQMAIAGILEIDIRYLLTGEERGETISYSAEAEEVARLTGKVPDPSDVPTAFLQEAIRRIGNKVNFYTLDVAQTASGEWIVIELNDGSMAGLSCIEPDVFYQSLADVDWSAS